MGITRVRGLLVGVNIRAPDFGNSQVCMRSLGFYNGHPLPGAMIMTRTPGFYVANHQWESRPKLGKFTKWLVF